MSRPSEPTPLDDLDHRLIERLVAGDSYFAAATACGVDRQTLYRRRQNPTFLATYAEARDNELAPTTRRLKRLLPLAVRTLARVMRDPTATSVAKLRAVELVFTNAIKLIDIRSAAELRSLAAEAAVRSDAPS